MNVAVFSLNAEGIHRADFRCGEKLNKFLVGMAKRALLYHRSVARLVELD